MRGENKTSTLTLYKAVDESNANHVLKNEWKKSIIWVGKSRFCVPPRNILTFVLQILGASYFLVDNELGDGEDIDRFVMPRGMFIPRISQIHCCTSFGLSYRIEY